MGPMQALEKTLRWIVLGALFAVLFVPLVVADGVHFPYNLFFPYITGKNFVFRFLVEVMAGAYLALALVYPMYRPRRSIVLGALALFVAVIGIADVFGVVPFKSLWSNFERMDGWVTLAHVLILAVIASAMITTTKLWRRFLQVSLGVSVYLSLYGLLQLVGWTTLGQGGAAGFGARIDATFGNPIYLAVYALFHIFIAAILWAEAWSGKRAGTRLPLSLAYGAVIAVNTLALLFTGTRGTTIGLIGGALLAAALMLLQSRQSPLVRKIAIGGIAALLLFAGGVWAIKDTPYAKTIGFIDRLSTISLQDATVQARFINWSIAWQGIKERPILGWGQENYAIVFDKYYDPRMYAQEPWFDRVHNTVFDWLVAGGFLGLLAYLSVFGAAIYAIWRSRFTPVERSLLTGLLAAYFCHNFFVFDNVTSYILFAITLAYIAERASASLDAPRLLERFKLSPSLLPYIALVLAIMVWGAAWWVNGRALAQNRLLLSAVAQQQEGVQKNLEYFNRAIENGQYGTQEAREQLAQGAMRIAASNLPDAVKQEFYDAGIRAMQEQAMASSLDARFPLFEGLVHSAFGNHADAAIALERALELSPKKQSIYFELAQNAQRRGKSAEALAYYKSAYELEPAFNTARFYYAAALITAGRVAEGEALIAPLVESGAAADERILNAYVARREFTKAAMLWVARIKARPTDVQAYFTLAAIYYEGGNRAQALAILEEVKRVMPATAAQADPLIKGLRDGTIK
jgi:O-antigen ligase/cytochrome c-type biogenesis protein CcmH/NrfG